MDNTAELQPQVPKPEATRENAPQKADKTEQEKPAPGPAEKQIVERIQQDGDQDQVLKDIAEPSKDSQTSLSPSAEIKPEEKVYEEPYQDPQIRQIEQSIATVTNQDSLVMRAMQSQDQEYTELWYQTYARVSMVAWDSFVANNPKKAEAYAAKYPLINTAIEARKRSLGRKSQSQSQQRPNSDEQQVTAEQTTEETGHEQQVDAGKEITNELRAEFHKNLKAIDRMTGRYEEQGFLRLNLEFSPYGEFAKEVSLLGRTIKRFEDLYRNPVWIVDHSDRDPTKSITKKIEPHNIIAYFEVKKEYGSDFTLYCLYDSENEGGVRILHLDEVSTHSNEDGSSWKGLDLRRWTNDDMVFYKKSKVRASRAIKAALEAYPTPNKEDESPPDKPAEAASIALKRGGGSAEIHKTVHYPSAEPLKH